MSEDSYVWKEEIFGPVVCIKPFKDEDDAIRMANDSRFGLAAAVMSKDVIRAERVAEAFRAGIVWVNCSQPTFVEAPGADTNNPVSAANSADGVCQTIWKPSKSPASTAMNPGAGISRTEIGFAIRAGQYALPFVKRCKSSSINRARRTDGGRHYRAGRCCHRPYRSGIAQSTSQHVNRRCGNNGAHRHSNAAGPAYRQ